MKKYMSIIGALALCAVFYKMSTNTMSTLQLTSPAFDHNQQIPVRFTCKGDNFSPPLVWKNAPDKTKSFVLIVDDPDAPDGMWVHWVLYDIPAHISELPENVAIEQLTATPGMTSWNKTVYGGPCPPRGTHRYFFKLYALDTNLNLPAGTIKKEVAAAMKGHIIAQSELIGLASH